MAQKTPSVFVTGIKTKDPLELFKLPEQVQKVFPSVRRPGLKWLIPAQKYDIMTIHQLDSDTFYNRMSEKYLDMFCNPAWCTPGPPGWESGAEQAPQGNPGQASQAKNWTGTIL